MGIGLGLGGIVLLIAIVVISSFRVLREYERGVVFMLGRFSGAASGARIRNPSSIREPVV